MTNCPNCGAPYKLNSYVCEYCGTTRELSEGERRKINITVDNSAMGEVAHRRFLELRDQIDPFDPSQQTACEAQALANAAACMICGFQQAQFTACEREQNIRLMQNAFPYTPPPMSVKRKEKRRFSPANPFLFWVCVVCLILCVLLATLPFTGNIKDWDVLPMGVKIFADCFAVFACLAMAWGARTTYKGLI